MDDLHMLLALKTDLGITTDAYDDRLRSRLQTARERIEQEGVTLDETRESDRDLVILYAAWLWRARGYSGDAGNMPRMLRYALNNRIFSEKGAAI